MALLLAIYLSVVYLVGVVFSMVVLHGSCNSGDPFSEAEFKHKFEVSSNRADLYIEQKRYTPEQRAIYDRFVKLGFEGSIAFVNQDNEAIWNDFVKREILSAINVGSRYFEKKYDPAKCECLISIANFTQSDLKADKPFCSLMWNIIASNLGAYSASDFGAFPVEISYLKQFPLYNSELEQVCKNHLLEMIEDRVYGALPSSDFIDRLKVLSSVFNIDHETLSKDIDFCLVLAEKVINALPLLKDDEVSAIPLDFSKIKDDVRIKILLNDKVADLIENVRRVENGYIIKKDHDSLFRYLNKTLELFGCTEHDFRKVINLAASQLVEMLIENRRFEQAVKLSSVFKRSRASLKRSDSILSVYEDVKHEALRARRNLEMLDVLLGNDRH